MTYVNADKKRLAESTESSSGDAVSDADTTEHP